MTRLSAQHGNSALARHGLATAALRLMHSAHADSILVGALGAVIAFAFVGAPSVWFDEAATVVAATRPWPDLARMLTNVDIVHATYYAFMHVWFDVFPYSPVSLRMPSVLATGVAAGLTVTLGRMLNGRRVGLLAGLLFCVLPRVTWMGGEGRSFAIATMLAVGTTIVFIASWRRTVGGTSAGRWWIAYTVLAILSCAVFLYLALLIAAHGATVALSRLQRQNARITAPRGRTRAGLCWLLAALIIAASLVPLALLASRQTSQISWIARPGRQTAGEALTDQWFYKNVPFAVFAWLLVVIGIVATVRRRRGADVATMSVAMPWMFLPPLGLIAVSITHTPLYSPRYVTFGAPAVALAMALGVNSLKWRPAIAAVLAIAVALTLPTFVRQRQPTAKDASAWNQVAALVSTQRSLEPVASSDAVIFGPVRRHHAASSRIIQDTYPYAFSGMNDVTLKKPARATNGLWEAQYPLAQSIGKTRTADVVWLITSNKQDWRPRVGHDLALEGFHMDRQWHLTRTNVVRYER